MAEEYDIRYLPNQQIDKIKWDNCITTAPNGLIYAYSFYLDHMAKNWDALVLGDYKAVMPLTWNKKYGFAYLYQPFLTAQLGVFGERVTEDTVTMFIKSIPQQFRLIEISLNSGNICTDNAIQRSNYVIDLNKSYEELYSSFRENNQRNIKKAQQVHYSLIRDFNVENVINLAIEQMRSQDKESADNIDRFRKLYQYLHAKQMAITYGILSADNEMLASCVFFFSHGRAYYILVGNNPKGRSTGASHALIDAFIKENAGNDGLLDFEGSDIPSLAQFYAGFGAKEERYPALKINRLPFYLKWMK